MIKSRIVKIVLTFISSFLSTISALSKPNIILIVADDAGYGDFGFHGIKIMKTPELDKFAAQSMHFKQAYITAAVCGKSRTGILSSKYQQRFGYKEAKAMERMDNYRAPKSD